MQENVGPTEELGIEQRGAVLWLTIQREERRNAIADSRYIRTSALLGRVTTYTTIAGAEAAVEGMKYLDQLDVISVQEMHAQLA